MFTIFKTEWRSINVIVFVSIAFIKPLWRKIFELYLIMLFAISSFFSKKKQKKSSFFIFRRAVLSKHYQIIKFVGIFAVTIQLKMFVTKEKPQQKHSGYLKKMNSSWKSAWESKEFRLKFTITLSILILHGLNAPAYFNYIQTRDGEPLNDYLFNIIPAKDVSIPIFTLVYGSFIYLMVRILPNARLFLLFILTFEIETIFRFSAIYLFPLNPPVDLVALRDPILEGLVYHDTQPITKDLFFSGHFATIFMTGLLLPLKRERQIAVAASILLGILLLVQRIHYTTDVLGSAFFTWLAYQIAIQIERHNRYYKTNSDLLR